MLNIYIYVMYILFFENERCPRKEKPLEILDSSKPFKLWIQDVKFEHISTPYLTVYMKHHPWNLPPHLPPMSHRQPQRGPHKPRGWNSWEVSSSSGVVAVCSTSEYVKTWGEKRSRGFSPFIQFFLRFPSVKGFDGLLFNRFPSKQDEISDQFRGE